MIGSLERHTQGSTVRILNTRILVGIRERGDNKTNMTGHTSLNDDLFKKKSGVQEAL